MVIYTITILLLIQIIQSASGNDILTSHFFSANCLTPKNEDGLCISLYECPALLTLLPKSEEYVQQSWCGLTSTEPLVCCPLNSILCKTPAWQQGQCTSLSVCASLLGLLQSQKAESIKYVRKSTCRVTKSNVYVCCPFPPRTTSDLLPDQTYCGYQNSDGYSSKVQGADITEFPWLVGLSYGFEDGQEKINCQGAIINNRYILTAGHCVVLRPGITLKTVRLGEYNNCVQSDGCSESVQEFEIEEVVAHPQFEQKQLPKFDIALIRLNQTVVYSDYIRPICLPGTKTPAPGAKVITTRSGSSPIKFNIETKKKVVNVLLNNNNCQYMYRNNYEFPINLTDNQMCTHEVSNNTESACSGDSGGPVMYLHKLQWFIIGVHSHSSTKCEDKYPIVHTKVSKFMDWIRDTIKP